MVEIKHSDHASPCEADRLATSGSSADSSDDIKYRLIYSKSKVYVNPTAYARDNIPGFVALVKKVCRSPAIVCCVTDSGQLQEASRPVYLLAWIPESLLHEKGQSEWDKFTKIEEHAVTEDEDEGPNQSPASQDI